MKIEFSFLPFLASVFYVAKCDDPPGHLQPLGSHMPPIKIDVIDTPPSPQEFLDKYIKDNKPVVIKGAAKVFSNFNTWKDDDYLSANYGKWNVPTEVGKIEIQFPDIIPIEFANFLKSYKKRDLCIIRDIVSENPMRDELSFIKSMSCGGFQERISKVILLFSSGSAQSAIHWDMHENMHCLLDGTKNWTIIHRKDRHILPKADYSPVYSAVDPKSVDMYKYPVMQDMPCYQAVLEAGDCLFVPNNAPHYVKSGDSRNMAFSIWFDAPRSLNLTDCPENEADLPDSAPIGHSVISDLEGVKAFIYTMIDDRSDKLSVITFDEMVRSFGADEETPSELRDALDTDRDGFITAEEIEALTDVTDEMWSGFLFDTDQYEEVEDLGKSKQEKEEL
uniref:bifunctional peptidase and arginyl-hydroxylase JMJD5-like n=1 Tax=Styela clava TaxID=7725 RepID=UPI001939ACF1|nr:bifunctional peptidase and arginyl-hydroxylase JMJD5-like [Styela clava]